MRCHYNNRMNFFSSIGNAFKGLFRMFGLFKKNAKIIFVGLDDAGKTTLMSVLKFGIVSQFEPTSHAHAENLEIGNLKVNSVDLGGHKTMRKVWRDFFLKIDAIVYLVDAANAARFNESKEEFFKILETPDLGKVPILILGNKIDKVSEYDNRKTQ